MDKTAQIQKIEDERTKLEAALSKMVKGFGPIPIANKTLMPYGWRKAAKGRTVWRIVEEIISQNLEMKQKELGFTSCAPASSEVGIFDFEFRLDGPTAYANIKSAVEGVKSSKDDISKAERLLAFYAEFPTSNVYVATFEIRFNDDMTIEITRCHVFPIAWIPDIYVNPSNNGNLQSGHYKDMSEAIRRTNYEFISLLEQANEVAKEKKRRKQ